MIYALEQELDLTGELVAPFSPPGMDNYMAEKNWNWTKISVIVAAIGIAVAAVVTLIAAAPSFQALSDSRRKDNQASEEKHLNDQIDGRINSNAKLSEILSTLRAIQSDTTQMRDRLSNLEGWRTGHVDKQLSELKQTQKVQGEENAALKKRVGEQEALAKLVDPNRVLATIRSEIELARNQSQVLPLTQVVDYKNAIRTLPTSARDYWGTVAMVVNHQSVINQLKGLAPDPKSVAQPCTLFTKHPMVHATGNLFQGDISGCIVDLDSPNLFQNITFVNCVVRYRGSGAPALRNVRFINCYFMIDLPAGPITPQQTKLLLALLQSPGQSQITIGG